MKSSFVFIFAGAACAAAFLFAACAAHKSDTVAPAGRGVEVAPAGGGVEVAPAGGGVEVAPAGGGAEVAPAGGGGEVVVPQVAELEPIGSKPVGVVLKATAFKMSGDFADHVAVTPGANGRLAYFPAITDITEYSRPVEIGDGWWLNRQGLGPQSVFTKWTFAEYMALPQTPSADEIKAAIIPDARVTDFRRLPITASEANQVAPASLLRYLQ